MLVSIIITTYNRPDALLLVLQSIESQTKFPHEVVIADDGSDINTQKLISNFKKSSKLNIIHSWQKDQGFRVAQSRNKAIAKSSGNYIILIDGDVILHHKFIQDHINNAQANYFVQGSRALLSEDETSKIFVRKDLSFSIFSRGLRNRKNVIHSNLMCKFFLLKKNYLHGIKTCNIGFFKKDCVDINGFNNDFEGWGREDSEFIVRLMNNGINRKNVHFNALQLHLWHKNNSREFLEKNNLILKEAIKNRHIWCDNGIDRYL